MLFKPCSDWKQKKKINTITVVFLSPEEFELIHTVENFNFCNTEIWATKTF